MKRTTGQAERGLQAALFLSALDVVLMGWAASQSTSLSILADWLKECADGLSVLMSWVTYRLVRGRRRGRYAYGIGKLENLVSLGIAALMLASALFVSYHAWHHLLAPRPVEGGGDGFLGLCGLCRRGFGHCRHAPAQRPSRAFALDRFAGAIVFIQSRL
jgi:divalent metal cation (Fe/Co/Zn/Cd) transporter